MSGTALPSGLGFVAWESEDSFADAADDTYTTRMQVRDAQIDVSGLVRPIVSRGGTFQHIGEANKGIRGPFTVGTFTTTFDLYGHGSATNTSLTATNLVNLLGHAIGNKDTSQVGGNVTTNSTGATDLQSTETTVVTGAMVRVGTLGDGRAEGQAVVPNDASTPYVLRVAMPGNATTADDVYAMQMIYPFNVVDTSLVLTSSGASSNNTLRFVLATSNYQFVCRGCACTGISITGLSPGETPQVSLTWSTVAWAPVAQTFPSATATADKLAVPCTGGSFFYNAKGTATRQTDIVRRFEVSIGHTMIPVVGQGGATTGQTVVGWRRGNARTTFRFAVEAEAATATPTWYDFFGTDPNSLTAKHCLYTANTVDGSAVAFYFPDCIPSGNQPTQTVIDGLNYVDVELEARWNDNSGAEIDKAPWKMGLG